MTVEVTLLGPVAMTRWDAGGPRRHEVRGRRERVAFVYLALEGDRGVTRDELAEAIWNGRPPPTWTSALRTVLSAVRRLVAVVLPGAGDALTGHAGRYELSLPPCSTVDVETARRAADGAREALGADAFAEAGRLAGQAVDLLRAPFLPDHDSDWAGSVRAGLDELLLGALELVSAAAVGAGDGAGALAAADEAVARSPLRESAHRSRIVALAAAGNRPEALRAYQALRRLLARELGVDPAPATEDLYLDLLGPSSRAVPSEVGPAPSEPFVGRRAESAAIGGAWRRAVAGERQVVVVTGAPGIGKSRLVIEAARRVVVDGGLVLSTRCDQDSAEPSPFEEVIHGCLAALAEAEPAGRDGDVVRSPAPGERTGLAVAVTAAIARASAARPVFAVVDDLHWADHGTLATLRHLVGHTAGRRLLLVAVTRGAPGQRHPLSGLAAALGATGTLVHLHLRGLDPPDAHALARAMGAPAAPDLPGHPLLLVEQLRAREPVPARVHDLVADLLDSVTPGARALVHAVSVVPDPVEPDAVAAVAGLDQDAASEALDEAREAGLVVAVDADGDPAVALVRPSHELVRLALHDRLGPHRRRVLHRRWAEVLERRAGRAHDAVTLHTAQVARHRLAAAGAGGDRDAVRAARQAAADAVGRRAHAEAARLLRAALGHVPPGADELRAEVAIELGCALAVDGDGGARHALVDGAVAARARGRPDLVARAALGLAEAADGHPSWRDDAAALARQALGDAARGPGRVDDLVVARLTARLVDLVGCESRTAPRLVAMGDRIARRLRVTGGPDQAGHRAVLARDLAVLAAAAGDAPARLHAAHHLAMAAAFGDTGSPSGAGMATLRDAAAAAARPEGDALVAEHEVATAVAEGRFAEAAARAAAPAWGAEKDHLAVPPPGAMMASQMLVAVWLQGGSAGDRALVAPDPVRAATAGRSNRWGPLDVPDRPPGPDRLDLRWAERVLRTLLLGDRGEARLAAHAAVGRLDELPADDTRLHVLALLAIVVVELDEPSLAEPVATVLTPYGSLACGTGYRSFVGTVPLHLGRLCAVAGDWAEAERHLTAAASGLAARRAWPWLALAQRALTTGLAARRRSSDLAWLPVLRASADVASRPSGGDGAGT